MLTLILDRKFSVKERLKIVSSVTTCVHGLAVKCSIPNQNLPDLT